jgi:hypothetical protein
MFRDRYVQRDFDDSWRASGENSQVKARCSLGRHLAVRIVNETLDELKVEQHPDKTRVRRENQPWI